MSDPQLAVFQAAIADRWVIDRDIGRGARATVYRTRDVEMLAGEPPFIGDNKVAVLRKTVTEAPVPITSIRDSLPSEVDVALDRLLAKVPSARYPDAAHLVDALSTLEAGSATERA